MVERIVNACQGTVASKTITILGVTFKPNTDDIREAPSIAIVPELQRRGATIKVYDPEGMNEGKNVLSNVEWCKNAYQAMEQSDAVAILTEWNEFRGLDLNRIKSILNQPTIIDLRNIYDPIKMKQAGFNYSCIGRRTTAVDNYRD